MPDIKGTSYEKEIKEVMNRFGVSREKAMKMIAKTYKTGKAERRDIPSKADRMQYGATKKAHGKERKKALKSELMKKKLKSKYPKLSDKEIQRIINVKVGRRKFLKTLSPQEKAKVKKEYVEARIFHKAEKRALRVGDIKETKGMTLEEKVEYYKKQKRAKK